MSNFTICTNHTEITVVDGQGHPWCPFCKIEELKQQVKDCVAIAKRGGGLLDQDLEELEMIEYEAQK